MTKRTHKLYLMDILESIDLISEYTKDRSEDQFLKDAQLQDAVVRRMEIIGEAGRNLADFWEGKYPKVPWNKMIGMRNVAAHEYFRVDLKTIWKTINNDLPALKRELLEILKGSEE